MPITLTTPYSLSGAITESDVSAAATSISIDFQAQTGTLVFQQGNISGGLLVQGAHAPFYVLTVNFSTGAWTVVSSAAPNTTVASGTFSGAGFTSFINQFVAIRNAGEGFAAASPGNFLPGTQSAWANGVIG